MTYRTYKPFEGYNPTKSEITSQMGKDLAHKLQEAGEGAKKVFLRENKPEQYSKRDFALRKNLTELIGISAGVIADINLKPYVAFYHGEKAITDYVTDALKTRSPDCHIIERRGNVSFDVDNWGSRAGLWTGMIAGMGILASQIAAYNTSAHEHPEVLAIPLTTNLISGVYQWMKDAREKIVQNKWAEHLERETKERMQVK